MSEEILAQLCDVLPCTSCNDNGERFELKHSIDISVEDTSWSEENAKKFLQKKFSKKNLAKKSFSKKKF